MAKDGRLGWTALGQGLHYRRGEHLGATVHAIRVDLQRFELQVADARRAGRKTAPVEDLAREAGAVAATNGTFFDEKKRPLGLLVSGGEELNPLREVSWWAALVVRDRDDRRAVELLPTSRLKALSAQERARIQFAMQVGPRTVVDGKVVQLKRQSAARSAVCIVSPDELVLLATEGEPLESNAFAAHMAAAPEQGGHGCTFGLMLDGGPSTQLWVDMLERGEKNLRVRGGWGVPNALVVVPRLPPSVTRSP